MNRDWYDFKALYGNISGARSAFESACETLFREVYKGLPVSQVRVQQGDGGIDVFIGNLGVEPIIVIQCKFFLDSFGDSQKKQIRKSFEVAVKSNEFKVKEWVLCVPYVLDIKENSWWFNWRSKKTSEHKETEKFISIRNGNELIDLLKQYGLYNQIFKIEDSIKIDEIYNAVVPKKRVVDLKTTNPNLVLFNNYSKKNEIYYLERSIDKEFSASLEVNNIWIFGNSGYGKTALVSRNLIKNDIEYCFCDLSPINISASLDVLEEVLCKLEETFDLERDNKSQNKIKEIIQLLKQTGRKKLIIVIDELAVADKSVLKEIASDFVKLVTYCCNSINGYDLRFIVSTLSSPKDIIENVSKATEHFQYINCDDWSSDIDNLFQILNSSLDMNLEEFKADIIGACESSPRILKSIFRKIIAQKNNNSVTIHEIIKTTILEVVN